MAHTTEPLRLPRLEREIARLAAAHPAAGVLGVCAIHVESGQRAEHNAQRRFPLASTYKLPIALQVLRTADEGRLRLDDMVTLEAGDISPGSGLIKDQLIRPGVALSVANLLDLALRVSDNTASDRLLRLAGGPSAVNAFLAAHGLGDLRVDRLTRELLVDFNGLPDVPAGAAWSLGAFTARYDAQPEAQRRAARRAFIHDPRDTGTPAAMAALLAAVQRRTLVSALACERLLDILRGCQTGAGRLRGLLPPATPIAHKTGSLADYVVNDAGLIELPEAGGTLAIAAFVAAEDPQAGAAAEHERLIAHVARAAYDYFVLGHAGPPA